MPLFNQSGYGSGRYGLADAGPIFPLGIGYYLNLYTSQYKLAGLMLGMTTTLLTPLADINTCAATFEEEFDLDSAVGAQLDILGTIIFGGLGMRTLPFQPSDGVSPVLDDTTYRLLLKARIARNQWNGTQPALTAIWQNLFPGGTIAIDDQQNMTAIVVLSGVFSSIIQDLIVNGFIVPRPETVQYTYTFAELPLLGFDQNNGFIAGLDQGHFV
jgi:hypothetical protein